MKNAKIVCLWVLLILVVGMIGCSSSSKSGGSTTTTTTTPTPSQALVGTWKCDKSSTFDVGIVLVFNADGTGNAGGSPFSNWKLNGTNLTWTGNAGNSELFTLVWDDTTYKGFTFTNTNPASPTVDHYVKQ